MSSVNAEQNVLQEVFADLEGRNMPAGRPWNRPFHPHM